MNNNTTSRERASLLGAVPSKTGEMFDRAEALQNAARTIKGIAALDKEALEYLYTVTKAERRARNQVEFENRVSEVSSQRYAWSEQTEARREEVRKELKAQDSFNHSDAQKSRKLEAFTDAIGGLGLSDVLQDEALSKD